MVAIVLFTENIVPWNSFNIIPPDLIVITI